MGRESGGKGSKLRTGESRAPIRGTRRLAGYGSKLTSALTGYRLQATREASKYEQAEQENATASCRGLDGNIPG